MYPAAAIVSILLAFLVLVGQDLSLGPHERGVVRRGPGLLLKGTSAQLQSHMGLGPGLVHFIGVAEISPTVGLIVGRFWRPLGIAAVGFGALLIGAVGFHARADDCADPQHTKR
jgi:hypothetical protein